ncbi:hypothetical protein BVX97_06330 [bacterium E08(2017)]|nr:hypothetical protein BVX97_06330 [bacterium E08(2017)]
MNMKKLMVITSMMVLALSVQAATVSATWTVTRKGYGANCKRAPQANNFVNCVAGDTQNITVSGNKCTIASGDCRDLSRNTHWAGATAAFSNTVLAKDNPGEHNARFSGKWQRIAGNGKGNGNPIMEGDWRFTDSVTVSGNHEHSNADALNNITPTVTYPVEIVPYEVDGKDLPTIANQMAAHFPNHPFYAQCVNTSVTKSGSRKGTPTVNATCPTCSQKHVVHWVYRYTTLKVKGKSTITIPKWTAYDKAKPAEKAEWDRFIAATKVHENGHYLQGKAFANKVAARWAKARGNGWAPKSARSKTLAKGALSAEFLRILDEEWLQLDTDGTAYDGTTNHGATQGARLNTSI